MSMTPEERRAWNAERMRRYREANKEKLAEKKRRYREANKETEAEKKRQYREVNKEKVAEGKRRYREANKETEAERARQYREANKGKQAEMGRRYREANKERVAERKRRRCRRKGFTRENGSSFESWVGSIARPGNIFEAIANLQPDPGQTLAELIHEISGYAMEVCEQIANPSVIEDSPALTPPAAPDLF